MKKLFHLVGYVILTCTLIFTNGCITLMGPKEKQVVEIKTDPPGADVYDKNRVKLGTTPYTVSKMSERKMVLSIQKDGYEDNEIELTKNSKPGLLFLDAMMLCIPCIVDIGKEDNLTNIEGFNGTMQLRKKIKEYDKGIAAEIVHVENIASKTKIVGKLNNEKKTLESTDMVHLIGYPDYFDEAVYVTLKSGYVESFYPSESKKATTLNKPRISIRVSIKDFNFDLKGKSLKTYTGNCSMQTEWKIYKYKEGDYDKEKPVAIIPIETEGFRSQGNGEYLIPSLLSESAKDFMGIDTMYDYLSKLSSAPVIIEKGDVIKIKAPSKLTAKQIKDRFKNAVQSVVTVEGEKGFGSGVIISTDGYIITNYHVIEGEKKISVKLNQSIKLNADIIKTNPDYDLALLKITASDLKTLSFANSDEVEIGDEVYAIGTPTDIELGQTLTKGIVSGKRELNSINYIQSDVSISPGNSGGPMINDKGQVIGITTMKLVGKGIEGLGFCIPSNIVVEMLNLKFE